MKLVVIRGKSAEMGIGIDGKMTQKMYQDHRYNPFYCDYKRPTRIFINIANGTLWRVITVDNCHHHH